MIKATLQRKRNQKIRTGNYEFQLKRLFGVRRKYNVII